MQTAPTKRALRCRGSVLFTYLHLAADLELTRGLLDSGATYVAYETVTSPSGRPLPAAGGNSLYSR